MGITKDKLQRGQVALGGWIMIGNPIVAELMAGEAFDWICVDMEHTVTDQPTLENIARAVKPSGRDLLVRLHSCDPVLAKKALDIGADGIIIPTVNTPQQARQAVDMAMFPPLGSRGSSFGRCTDFGRSFDAYYRAHNDNVLVVVMLEHVAALDNLDAILSTPGVGAAFIGPYDLSASMGLPGQIDHPDVVAAQEKILQACKAHNVPAGFHVVPLDHSLIRRRIEQGYQFIGCGLDTEFIIHGCRTILGKLGEA